MYLFFYNLSRHQVVVVCVNPMWCRVKIGFLLWRSNIDLMKKYNSHFRNRERSSYIWKELGVELLLLCVESHKLMWFRHLEGWFLGASLWRFSTHAQDTLERLYISPGLGRTLQDQQ